MYGRLRQLIAKASLVSGCLATLVSCSEGLSFEVTLDNQLPEGHSCGTLNLNESGVYVTAEAGEEALMTRQEAPLQVAMMPANENCTVNEKEGFFLCDFGFEAGNHARVVVTVGADSTDVSAECQKASGSDDASPDA